jgi:hypothetical protein
LILGYNGGIWPKSAEKEINAFHQQPDQSEGRDNSDTNIIGVLCFKEMDAGIEENAKSCAS